MELTGNRYARGDWRKLLATRRGTILVAAICAAIAAGILVFAMQSYRHHVVAENNPETVFVANALIQKGTSGDAIAAQQLFKPASVAGKQVASGAIADASVLRGKVATADIYPGQQLTAIVQENVWVTANFKETQLADLRKGQSVKVNIDAIPGKHLVGQYVLPPERLRDQLAYLAGGIVLTVLGVKLLLRTTMPRNWHKSATREKSRADS